MLQHCRTALTASLFLGEKGATGEDFDQKESSDRQHHRGFTLHTARGIEFKFTIKINYSNIKYGSVESSNCIFVILHNFQLCLIL